MFLDDRPDKLLRCKGNNASIVRSHLSKCYTLTHLDTPLDPDALDFVIRDALYMAERLTFDPILVNTHHHTCIPNQLTVVCVFSGARRPHVPESGGKAHAPR